MNAAKAEEVQGVISARFPDAEVVVTPYGDRAEIRVSTEGQKDRNFKIDDEELDRPSSACWSEHPSPLAEDPSA